MALRKKRVGPKHLGDVESIEMIWGPPDEILAESDFRGYQRWMTDKVEELPGMLLGAEMGLGKTAAVLLAMRRLFDKGEIKKVLIVAPLKVAEDTWPDEICKWRFSRKFKWRVVTGTLAERRAALAVDAPITIINRENLPWLKRELGILGWDFDMLVYDEASRLKSGRKQSKPVKRKDGSMPHKRVTELGVIQSVRHRTKKIVELSGTPSPNGLIDLWGPIYAIDKGLRLGGSMTKFKERWFTENPWTRKLKPHDHAHAEIMSRIKDIFFSLREEDYLKLPPLVPVDHYVRLSNSEMAAYADFEKEAAIELRNRAGEKEIVAAVNNGVLTGKLLQFANGSMYLGDKWDEETGDKLPRESVRIHDHKLDVLDSIMEEAAGTPVLVAYSFQFDREAIMKRFPYCRLYGSTPNDTREWNAGQLKMMLLHPASAGHGLNIQKGSNIAVWYGLTWSLELYRQFVKRLHRSGQTRDKVFLHRIMTYGTIDETMLPKLEADGATQDRITDAVRVRLAQAA